MQESPAPTLAPTPDSISPALLRVSRVSKRFGAVVALEDVSLDVHSGEAVALLGDNGAGKTTLVKILSGNLRADSGTITFDGQAIRDHSPPRARALGIETVYQDLSLCPNLDAAANFFMGRELTKPLLGIRTLDDLRMRAVTETALADVGASVPSVRTNVAHLSGGQRQAIELARFVHWGGRLVILDEPFAALGVEQTRRGLELINSVKSKGVGVIVVTHNITHALRVADRIVVLRHGRVSGRRDVSETNADEIVRMITGELATME